jgi:hypothetical protein
MRIKSIALLTRIALITSILFCGSVPQLPVNAVRPALKAADAFSFTIETYGKAWDGYLAFGLWEFPYNATGFSLTPYSYLVVMTTKGQLLNLRTANGEINLSTWMSTYAPVKYLGQDTIMFDGEPDTSTHFWNLKTNVTTDIPNVYGHHDMIFNPVAGTFLTLRSYVRQIDGKNVLMDDIVELDAKGNTLWTWDTYTDGHFSLKDECPCNDTTVVDGKPAIDLTHANSLQWDFQTNIVYMNMRHLNTFCKINKTTDQTIWCLGEHGNFTLLGPDGKQVPSLWYHAHDVREIEPDGFTMFDNDYHNTTSAADPCPATFEETNGHSRMLEITVDEENMSAWTSWSWTAPREYWTPYWGSVDRLPNGDWIAAFGAQSHYLPGSAIGSPVPNSTGAAVVEVNAKGEVVRTYILPYGWGIYRVVPVALQTVNDYDGTMRTENFTINLSTLNDLGGPTNIYYRINNGATRTVATDGQPRITTEGSNNTLEYWSVDSDGIEESPHDILMGINMQKNVSSQMLTSTSTQAMPLAGILGLNAYMTFEIVVVVVAVVAVLFSVVMIRKRNRELK